MNQIHQLFNELEKRIFIYMRPKTVYGDDFIISIGQRSDQVKLKGDLNQLKCLIKLYQKVNSHT
jgi:hypothetical protein